MATFAHLSNESPDVSPRAADNLLGASSRREDADLKKSQSKQGFFSRGYNLFFGNRSASAISQEEPSSPDSALSPTDRNSFLGSSSSSTALEVDKSGRDSDFSKQRTSSAAFTPDLVGTEKLMFVSLIFTQNHAISLYRHLPGHLGMQDMKLVYSMSNDGSDLCTFYQKARGHSNTVLLIQTVNGAEYGCFSTSEWREQVSYYGSGESFIFSYQDQNTINAYKWTGKNTLFQFSSKEQIAMGGGGEGFGLLLKNDFDIAESVPCETYGNEKSLDYRNSDSGSSTSSRVCNIELWTFVLHL
jgi:hypothetical protein